MRKEQRKRNFQEERDVGDEETLLNAEGSVGGEERNTVSVYTPGTAGKHPMRARWKNLGFMKTYICIEYS